MKEPRDPSLLLVVPLAALGAALGLGLVMAFPGDEALSLAFRASGAYYVWLGAVVVQTMAYAVFPLALFVALRRLWPLAKQQRLKLALAGVCLLFLMSHLAIYAGVAIGIETLPLLRHAERFHVIVVLGTLTTALPAALGIILVQLALGRLGTEDPAAADAIERYLQYRRQLMLFLLVLGTVVGLVTLGAGAGRQALLAWLSRADVQVGLDWYEAGTTYYPVELILVYGGYFTVLLAMMYVPVHATLQRVGSGLARQLAPLPWPAEPPSDSPEEQRQWIAAYERRGRLEARLELHVTARQRLEAAVGILTPLASGLVSYLLS